MHRRILVCTTTILFLATATAHAVHFGWQALPEGGIEYLVEIEPDLLDSFRADGFTSSIPAGLRDVRQIRLSVGNQTLPHQDDINGPAAPRPPGIENAAQNAVPAGEPRGATDAPLENRLGGAPPYNSPPAANPAAAQAAAPEKAANHGGMAELLRFLEPGPARHITPGEAAPSDSSAGAAAAPEGKGQPGEATPPSQQSSTAPGATLPTGGVMDNSLPANRSTSIPKITAGEGSLATAAGAAGDGFKTFGTAMKQPFPEVSRGTDAPAATAAAPKPWLLLMAVLLVLFASLGANVYLVWIYQEVRAKYRAIALKLPREAAA